MGQSDIGESLVGAYMRYIEGCPIVLYNSFLADQQGEVDVVAVKPAQRGQPRVVYLCEVTTHVGGFNSKTTLRVDDKLARLREFASATFPDEQHRFQWWSPVVAKGATTTRFDELCAAWTKEGRSLEFVVNEEYTRRIDALVQHARRNPRRRANPLIGCCRYSPRSAASARPSDPSHVRRLALLGASGSSASLGESPPGSSPSSSVMASAAHLPRPSACALRVSPKAMTALMGSVL